MAKFKVAFFSNATKIVVSLNSMYFFLVPGLENLNLFQHHLHDHKWDPYIVEINKLVVSLFYVL